MAHPLCASHLAAAALLTVACGSDVVGDDGGSGGSGGAGATYGASTTGGQDLPCPELADVVDPPVVRFHFTNDSGQDVYLSAECGRVSGDVRPQEVNDVANFPWSTSCRATCEDAQKDGGSPQCDACDRGTLLIAPGETITAEWPAVSLVIADLPAACAPDGEDATCEQLVAAPAGVYDLEIQAYGSCPECTCDEEGRCDGSGEEPTRQLRVEFELPATDVDVVVESCFFPCPGG
jgi:hypothetical protein